MQPTREQRRMLARENARYPVALQEIPRSQWPDDNPRRLRVWRSRHWLVQEFVEHDPVLARLSINRTEVFGDRFADGISWDELQAIKNECGYANHDAVEMYPPASGVVNVANMRHLWIMVEKLPFGWRADGTKRDPADPCRGDCRVRGGGCPFDPVCNN